jgi:hypothetical protein
VFSISLRIGPVDFEYSLGYVTGSPLAGTQKVQRSRIEDFEQVKARLNSGSEKATKRALAPRLLVLCCKADTRFSYSQAKNRRAYKFKEKSAPMPCDLAPLGL